MSENNITRRGILRTIGAGAAVAGGLSTGVGARGPPDRHIVGTASDAGTRAAVDRADSVRHVLDFGEIGQAVAGVFAAEARDALGARDDVRYVEADGTVHALSQTLPWGIDRVDAEVAHANGETGNGADVAIIDTGIDDDHPDLQANVGAGKAYVDCKGPNCNYPWSDDNDHGTHCAGIADAVNNSEGVVGVSTEATLHAVKVLDSRGSGTWSDVAAGIEYTADQGWDVGSLSLGADSGNQTVKDACQYAYDNGVLLVAAAGNDGPCTDCVGYPAAYSTVIAISATSKDDSLASFSSTGPEVELAAPGENVYSTVIGGYDTFDGTSMACPHVSGGGAQLMTNGYTNTEARDQLNSTAEDIGLASNEQGNGLLDVAAALGLDSSDDLSGDDGGGGGGDNPPSIDSWSYSTRTTGPWFRVETDWSVSDKDGDLDTVTTDLLDSGGSVLDSESSSVSGSDASGSHEVKTRSSDASDMRLTVTDAAGNSTSDTKSL